MTVQPGLYQTWSEPKLLVFSHTGSFLFECFSRIMFYQLCIYLTVPVHRNRSQYRFSRGMGRWFDLGIQYSPFPVVWASHWRPVILYIKLQFCHTAFCVRCNSARKGIPIDVDNRYSQQRRPFPIKKGLLNPVTCMT